MSEVAWPLVTEKDPGIRPAGKPDECFYCHGQVGSEHAKDCVMVRKTMRVRFMVELDLSCCHSWTDDEIEFRFNESSWCASNLIALMDEAKRGGKCLCGSVSAQVIASVDLTPRVGLE